MVRHPSGFYGFTRNVNDEILAAMVVVVHEIILSKSRGNVWSNPKSGMCEVNVWGRRHMTFWSHQEKSSKNTQTQM